MDWQNQSFLIFPIGAHGVTLFHRLFRWLLRQDFLREPLSLSRTVMFPSGMAYLGLNGLNVSILLDLPLIIIHLIRDHRSRVKAVGVCVAPLAMDNQSAICSYPDVAFADRSACCCVFFFPSLLGRRSRWPGIGCSWVDQNTADNVRAQLGR